MLRDKPFIARVRTNNKLNTQGIAILVTGMHYQLSIRITPNQTEEEKGLYIPLPYISNLQKFTTQLIPGNTNK